MYSLLTGRSHVDYRNEMELAKQPFTAAAHLDAMRRLLLDATTGVGELSAETLLKAAEVHAEAAKSAPKTLARSVPRDGDAL